MVDGWCWNNWEFAWKMAAIFLVLKRVTDSFILIRCSLLTTIIFQMINCQCFTILWGRLLNSGRLLIFSVKWTAKFWFLIFGVKDQRNHLNLSELRWKVSWSLRRGNWVGESIGQFGEGSLKGRMFEVWCIFCRLRLLCCLRRHI